MKDIGFWHSNAGDELKICGRFRLAAGPVMGEFVGQGFTPTRTGVGNYLLTFTGAASKLVSAKACCWVNANNVDLYPQFGAFTAGGAGAATLELNCTAAGGAATELPVGATDWVNFEITLYGECLAT